MQKQNAQSTDETTASTPTAATPNDKKGGRQKREKPVKILMNITFNDVDDRGRAVHFRHASPSKKPLIVRAATRQFVPKFGKTYMVDVELVERERITLAFAEPADFDGLDKDEWLSPEEYAKLLQEELVFEKAERGARAFASNGQVVFARHRVPIIFGQPTLCMLVEKGRVAIATPIPDYVLEEMRQEEAAAKAAGVLTSSGTALANYALGENLIDPKTLEYVLVADPKTGVWLYKEIFKLLVVRDDRGNVMTDDDSGLKLEYTRECSRADLKKIYKRGQKWLHPDAAQARREEAGLQTDKDLYAVFTRRFQAFQAAYQSADKRFDRLEEISKAEKKRKAHAKERAKVVAAVAEETGLSGVEEAVDSLGTELATLQAFDKLEEYVQTVVMSGTSRENGIKLIATALADLETIEEFEKNVPDMSRKVFLKDAANRYDEYVKLNTTPSANR